MTAPQSRYEVIVVGTDGSERAGIAVRKALALAKLTGAKLHVVHAFHVGGGPTAFPDDYKGPLTTDHMREEADRIGQKVVAEAEQESVSVELHNSGEDPAVGIINVATAVGADLVVVGNRGMTGAKRFVLGSVPNAVAHKSPCSVLIVSTD
jgi:nucleotide-binding universal stress UspA family protein